MALEQLLRSPHDWSVDHFSVDSERTAPPRLCLGVLGDDAPGVGHLRSRRRILLVDDGHLSRMDTAGAHETELARTPDHGAKRVPIGEGRHACKKPKRLESRCAGG